MLCAVERSDRRWTAYRKDVRGHLLWSRQAHSHPLRHGMRNAGGQEHAEEPTMDGASFDRLARASTDYAATQLAARPCAPSLLAALPACSRVSGQRRLAR